MSNEAKREYIELMRKRYREAVKFKKSWILDQVSEVCGFSREHARKVMSGRSRIRGRRSGPQAKYGALVRKHLRELWFAMGGMCSKRLKEALPLWLRHYEAADCTLEVRQQLLTMAPATIDRILRPYRRGAVKGISTTKSSLFKDKIPVRLLGEIVSRPGFVEADTVAHCGASMQGDFIHTLTLTDVASGWTENRASWNKKAAQILELIQELEQSLPFELYGFSCDNGNEFLNEQLLGYFEHCKRKAPIHFVRGRPYQKNDNPHVEQKNFTHVRQLLGYQRLEEKDMVELINRLYRDYWNPLLNFFHPSVRLETKERLGAKIKKTWDKPKTPYQRLLESEVLSSEQKAELKQRSQKLNPFVLQFKVRQLISLLNEMIRRSKEGVAAA